MVEEGEEKIGDLPDELRCRRSDGRQWRCKRRVVGEGKMCAYHLCRSNGKGVRVRRVVERKERGRVEDEVKLSVEENGVVELGDGMDGERKSLDGEGGSVSNSGRKRKGVKRYGDGDEEEGLSGGSKKEERNVDESLKLGGEEVELVAEGCNKFGSGRKRRPVKRYGDVEEKEDLSRGGKKKVGNVDMLSTIKNVKKDVRDVTVRRVALDEEMVPDHLRCIRTDGKRWRCSRHVKDGATMCENHYIQGRLRQAKAVVPESLKLQRRDKLSLFKCSQIQVSKFGGGKKRRPVKWRQWSKFSETLDGALRKLQLKKSDTELQLLKAYLKRQAEKLEMQQQFAGAEGYCQKEVTKDLPFGAMTISASPALQAACVAGISSNLKIGSDPDTLSGVSFRSKNIEPVPIGSSKVMPGVKEMVKLKREKKRCHLCHKLGSHMAKCSACKNKSFCMECIKERYRTSRDDVEKSCPVFCRQCGCVACLPTQSKDAEHENSQNVERRLEKVAHARKLIYLLLPVLKHIKDELRLELELEANKKGKSQSEVSNRQFENSCNEQIYCENGKGCNVSTLCLNCSGDLTERLTNDADMLLSNYFNQTLNTRSSSRELVAPLSSSFWKFGVNDGIVCCPPVNFDGCEHCLLVLRRVFMSKWINALQENAEKEVSSFFDTDGTDVSSCRDEGHESEPIEQVKKASSRNNSNDNFLYYPSIKDGQLLENFHKHWWNNRPIVVRNVLHQTPDLCWDPIFFFCSYLERCSADSADATEVEASNCLNWCEVEIGIRQSYVGQSKGWNHANMWDETLKLKGCLSSHLFQNKFPDHYDGIVRSLPHQEYMNPMVGRSNLAVNIPPEVKPDLGPYVHISYGIRSDSVDSMGMLCYNSYDAVNIMMHSTEVAVPSEQVTQVRKLMEKKWSEYQEASIKMTSGITTLKKKGKLSKEDDIFKGTDLSNKGGTTCEGESGESYNSVVVHEPCGRSAADINKSQESGSDLEASNFCSEKKDDEIVMRNFGSVEDADDDSASVSCSAEWDVFRRKDIPTLLDYLKLHSDKLSQPSGVSQNGAQPVLGRSVFLQPKDKSRLMEEYGIEPWTFKQRVGEAVIIPAGCPYQIRALKSCVSVAFDFVSPECASARVDLSKDLKLLSDDHVSEDKLEVKKMVLYNISAALQQLSELNPAG